MAAHWIGAPVVRREDERLLTGKGRFVDDLHPPGCLHAAVLRSPYAHARIISIDAEAARALPGLVAVLTPVELGDLNRSFSLPVPHPKLRARTPTPLAREKVRYSGEPVAVVVAENRYIAEDALDLIAVEYEPLPATSGLEEALAPGQATVHDDLGDNIAACFSQTAGDVDAAFSQADLLLEERFIADRGSGQPMETRVVLAVPTDFDGITVWDTTQTPHVARRLLSHMLALPEHQVRVIAPDVGGGFGPKAVFYPEEFLIPYLARNLKRPVKWVEDRLEHFRATVHERTQIHDVEIAVRKDGTLLGLRVRFLHDTGAYVPWGVIVPLITMTTIPGPYRVPNYFCEATVVYTNRVPVTPHRGAGRPQAVFVMERIMDQIAFRLGLDPVEVRRRNFIQPEEFPYNVGLIYRDGSSMTYDSGNYPECLRVALEEIGYADFAEEQRRLRAEGRYVGIGIAAYVEGTGLGPHESARLRIDSFGKVQIASGAATQGQGHETTMSQVAAEILGQSIEDIQIATGDTTGVPYGIGAFASRVGALGNSAVKIGAIQLKEKILKAASAMLEVAIDDLELVPAKVQVKGAPGKSISLAELAIQCGGAFPGSTLPHSVDEVGLEVTAFFRPEQSTYASGVHAVKVEVDPSTGRVQICKYVVVHDCGNAINPLIVEGQVHGGVAAGVGGTLYEKLLYDAEGQLITGTFMDYLLPTAVETPPMVVKHVSTPTPLNPLGAKGAGEGGTIPAPAAIVCAIDRALWPEGGIHLREFPLAQEQVHRAAKQALMKLSHGGERNTL
ncbi:MAG: molybdopterin cofactor-binding domain-containing protein [Ktedonobacteraceae bacterium]